MDNDYLMLLARRQYHADMNAGMSLERTTRRLKGLNCNEIYPLRQGYETKATARAAKSILKLTTGHRSNASLMMRARMVNILAGYSRGKVCFPQFLPSWFLAIEQGVRYMPTSVGQHDCLNSFL